MKIDKGTTFYILFFLIFLSAAFLRLYDLTLRPIHHDEGVIGWFMENIRQRGDYTYDADYHGPFQYHFGALVFAIFGVNDWILRAPTALFNLATILLLLPLRRYLGDAGTLVAAGLLAVSTSMVYFAQRAYMDNEFIFFAMGMVASIALFFQWKAEPSRHELLKQIPYQAFIPLTFAFAALLLTTKETAFILFFIFAMFVALEYAYRAFSSGRGLGKLRDDAANFVEKDLNLYGTWIAAGIAVFAILYVVIFTTAFQNMKNLYPALTNSVTFWLSRSTTWEGHFKPFGYWLEVLSKYEQPVLLLAVIGAFFSLRTPQTRFFLVWALLSFLIYSAIPYKTPWLDPHLILPFSLVGGVGVQAITDWLKGRARLVPGLVVLALLGFSAYNAWNLTYVNYDDDRIMLVYVQNDRDYNRLLAAIDETAKNFQGYDTEIAVVSNEYWPLPWSLRDYKRVAYWGKTMDNMTQTIIISSKSDSSEIKPELRGDYNMSRYTIRPGLEVWAYFKQSA